MTKLGPGFAIRDGKVVPVVNRHLSVSAKIAQKKSKRTRVAKKGAIFHGDGKRNPGKAHGQD